MPAKRNQNRRRNRGGRRRGPGTRQTLTSVPRGVGTPFRYQRNFVAASNTLSAGSAYLAALTLGPATWPSAFSALIASNYDLYRVDHVKVTFVPYFNVNGTNSVGADDSLPQICWVINYDDTSTPASYDAVMAQTGSRFTRFNRPVSVNVQPRALASIASAGGNTNGMLIGPGAWFNAGGSSVLFLGLKYGITATTGTPGGGRFDINYQVHLTCLQNIT